MRFPKVMTMAIFVASFLVAGCESDVPRERVEVKAGTVAALTQYPRGKDVFVFKKNGTLDERPNDLEELTRDWLYYRTKILAANGEGDVERAAEYRTEFQKINRWLSEYHDSDVNAMLALVSDEGR